MKHTLETIHFISHIAQTNAYTKNELLEILDAKRLRDILKRHDFKVWRSNNTPINSRHIPPVHESSPCANSQGVRLLNSTFIKTHNWAKMSFIDSVTVINDNIKDSTDKVNYINFIIANYHPYMIDSFISHQS